MLDFGEGEISEYTRHWCTAVRLAQNEPEGEARREGTADGDRIVDGFKGHPYIRNLARNPLMLSAICLVNYFEGGELPQGRTLLYKFCVEGLLHHWDQRRGIRSEFGLEEKLRTCREVALAMQADDRAEYEAERVHKIFTGVLVNSARAEKLLEHIRRRTGLLLERRPGVFAFAHLTFQEYLAARALHEGNQLGVDCERLVREHHDSRWEEVIPLYCGLVPSRVSHHVVEQLIAQPDTRSLPAVLAEAYLSAGPELSQDRELHRRVLDRIAIAAGEWPSVLERFPVEEVAPIANLFVGKISRGMGISQSHRWLYRHPEGLDVPLLVKRLRGRKRIGPSEAAELTHLLHAYASTNVLTEIASDSKLYAAPSPKRGKGKHHGSLAEVALIGLAHRSISQSDLPTIDTVFLQILRTLSDQKNPLSSEREFVVTLPLFLDKRRKAKPPKNAATWPEFAALARGLAKRMSKIRSQDPQHENGITALNSWAETLDRIIAEGSKKQIKRKAKVKSKTGRKRTRKKSPQRR